MNYSEMLKSPKWQKKRLEIMERDGWKCTVCGNTENQLQVHHVKYINGRKPWEYENDELKTLCIDCHKDEHLPQIEATLSRGCIHPKDVVKAFPIFNKVFKSIHNHKGRWSLTLREKGICDDYQKCLALLFGYAWFDTPFDVFGYNGCLFWTYEGGDGWYEEIVKYHDTVVKEGHDRYFIDNPESLINE